jgi:hypothetical protein
MLNGVFRMFDLQRQRQQQQWQHQGSIAAATS